MYKNYIAKETPFVMWAKYTVVAPGLFATQRQQTTKLFCARRITMALVLVFLCSASAFASNTFASNPKDQYGALFITSTDPDQPGIAAVIEQVRIGIEDAIEGPTHFDIEYLDPQLSGTGPGTDVGTAEYFRAKYSRQRFDLIIAIGPQALRFSENHGSLLFPGARVLSMMLGPGRSDPDPVFSAPVTTLYVEPDFAPTLKVALAQNPGTQQVFLIAGSSASDKRQLQWARANLAIYASRLHFFELTNYTFAQLQQKLSELEPHSVVLFVDFTADSTGEEYVSTRALRKLSQSANCPIYGVFREQIGSGALGGSVLDMREAGRMMGKAAVQVLNGETPKNVLVLGVKQQHYVFDARQLKRWNIGEVPSGSTVLNQDYLTRTLYERKFIMLALAVCLEALLIVLLFKATLRRKRAERDLARLLAVVRLESCLAASIISLPVGLIRTEIRRGFSQFIDLIGIDCISIYEFQQKKSQFRLLCYSSARKTKLRLARLKPSEFQQTADKLLRGQSVVVRTASDLPQEALSTMEELRRAELHSIAGFPIIVDRRVVGALFFSASKDPDWDGALLEELQTIANIVGSGLDRAKTHASLGRSEQLKSAIFTSLPASVVVLDREGCVIDFNSSAIMMSFELNLGSGSLTVGTDYRELCR
jgi:PAS domain-containing protein